MAEWTNQLPTKDGHYWSKSARGGKGIVKRDSSLGFIYWTFHGTDVSFDEEEMMELQALWWSEPIQPPA